MSGIRPYILDTLPQTYEASAIYFIRDVNYADRFTIYLANNTGSAVRRQPTQADIDQAVADAMAGVQAMQYAPTITARDNMTFTGNAMIYVADATADADVNTGGATYFYVHATQTFIRTAEDESMDLALTWAALVGGPNSTPNQIDDAVQHSHNHLNATAVNAISLDGNGDLVCNGKTLNGALPLAAPAEW
jgi:hypothetical protein